MPSPAKFDSDRYDAESQVSSAFMETPAAKKAVRATMKAIKSQKAETKKLVAVKPSRRKK